MGRVMYWAGLAQAMGRGDMNESWFARAAGFGRSSGRASNLLPIELAVSLSKATVALREQAAGAPRLPTEWTVSASS